MQLELVEASPRRLVDKAADDLGGVVLPSNVEVDAAVFEWRGEGEVEWRNSLLAEVLVEGEEGAGEDREAVPVWGCQLDLLRGRREV